MARAAAQAGEAWYEVESLRRQRWLIDAVSRDRQVAVEEAGRLLRREDVAGVRVRRERLHPRWGFAGGWLVLEHVKPETRRPLQRWAPAPAPQEPGPEILEPSLHDAAGLPMPEEPPFLLLSHAAPPSLPGWLGRAVARARTLLRSRPPLGRRGRQRTVDA